MLAKSPGAITTRESTTTRASPNNKIKFFIYLLYLYYMATFKVLILFALFKFITASVVEFFAVTPTAGYQAVDNNLNTFWQPSTSATEDQILTLSFATPQVLGNLSWVIKFVKK